MPDNTARVFVSREFVSPSLFGGLLLRRGGSFAADGPNAERQQQVVLRRLESGAEEGRTVSADLWWGMRSETMVTFFQTADGGCFAVHLLTVGGHATRVVGTLVDLFSQLLLAGASPTLIVEIPEVQEDDWWPFVARKQIYGGLPPLVLGLTPETEPVFPCAKTAVEQEDVEGGRLFLGYRTGAFSSLERLTSLETAC